MKPANVNVIPGGGQITDPNAPDYNANAAEFARDREEFVQNDAPAAASDPFSGRSQSPEPNVENSSAADVSANQDSGLLTPAQSIARAQTTAPADVEPANTGVFANPNFSQEAISGTPAPVDRATDQGVKSPFGGAASNAAAAQNPEAAAAAYQQEQANQAAAMKLKAQQEAAVQAEFQSPANGDWRVRLRLAPGATYLYKDKDVAKPAYWHHWRPAMVWCFLTCPPYKPRTTLNTTVLRSHTQTIVDNSTKVPMWAMYKSPARSLLKTPLKPTICWP
jgi:hypothetical protein